MKNVRRYNRMIRRSMLLIVRIDLKARRLRRNKKLTFDQKYKATRKLLNEYHRRFRVNVISTGIEHIPEDIKGCMFIGNHQGKDDCQVVLHVLEKFPTSFVINDARSHGFLLGPVCDALECERIKFDDISSQAKVYNDMAENIKNGRRYILFPEAGYADNKNNLQKFNSACFGPIIKSKCPIIPFCLYDTWKVYGDDSDMVDVECHILEPIMPEEYVGMNKKKLCDLVEARILEKLNQLKKEKGVL